MPFHTVAWRVSLADATATDLTPVPDSIMLVQNAHFVPQNDMSILWAYFGSTGPNRARFISPALRQTSTPWVRPLNTDIVPGNLPGVANYLQNPIAIRALEELQMEGMQTTGGAVVGIGVAALARSIPGPAPSGAPIIMRGTGTTTATAGAWSLVTTTWQDSLPTGTYAVVGLQAIGTTLTAARLVFEDQVERPGVLGCSAVDLIPPAFMIDGSLGIFGRFNANRMPNIEVLCNAADTAQEFYLAFVRVA